MNYPVIRILGGEGDQKAWKDMCFAGDPSRSETRCPICRSAYSHYKTYRYLAFYCGGQYVTTVDRDGNPIWAGRCGLPLVQKQLTFVEEQA